MKFSKTAELVEFTDCLPETRIYSNYKNIFDIWILFSKCKGNTNLSLINYISQRAISFKLWVEIIE